MPKLGPLLLIAMVTTNACFASTPISLPPATSRTAAPSAEALALPTLRPGAQCPRSSWEDIGATGAPTSLGEPGGAYTVLGTGPAFPIIYNFDRASATLSLTNFVHGDRYPYWDHSWNKLRWIVSPDYRGPLVIRGAQLGGTSPVLFPVPELTALRVDASSDSGWRDIPGGISVEAPGCYAFEIDADGAKHVLVFEVVP